MQTRYQMVMDRAYQGGHVIKTKNRPTEHFSIPQQQFLGYFCSTDLDSEQRNGYRCGHYELLANQKTLCRTALHLSLNIYFPIIINLW